MEEQWRIASRRDRERERVASQGRAALGLLADDGPLACGCIKLILAHAGIIATRSAGRLQTHIPSCHRRKSGAVDLIAVGISRKRQRRDRRTEIGAVGKNEIERCDAIVPPIPEIKSRDRNGSAEIKVDEHIRSDSEAGIFAGGAVSRITVHRLARNVVAVVWRGRIDRCRRRQQYMPGRRVQKPHLHRA